MFWGIEINHSWVGDAFKVVDIKDEFDATRGLQDLADDDSAFVDAVEYFGDGEGYMAYCHKATCDENGNVIIID